MPTEYIVEIIDGGYSQNYLEQLDFYIEKYAGQIIFVGMSVMTTQVPFALEAAQEIAR